MRFTALLPLTCAIASFVLAMLCLFAGSKPGFMEDYHIVALNTSTLGHVIFNSSAASSTATSTSSAATATATSVTSWLSGILHNATSSVENATSSIESSLESDFESIEGDLVDKLATELGISQWYSLHLMDMCEGNFAPNASTPGASYNVSKCTNQTAMYHFDPTAAISAELSSSKVGSLVNLTTIDYPDSVQNSINELNTAFAATFIFYVLGIAFSGLAILSSLVGFFLHGSRLVSLGNFLVAILAFLMLGVASAIITAVAVKIANEVNQEASDIGMEASWGGKFLGLTWGATGAMLLASVCWIAECCVGRRRKAREWSEKSAT
jgi:hypothetical protein